MALWTVPFVQPVCLAISLLLMHVDYFRVANDPGSTAGNAHKSDLKKGCQ